ncbi:MAG: 1,4-alpha-glucan branching protein GlgB [Erysipelotrichaceae bacterium]|nr:1,4-alpha-glucan branching protein GlgB [Erysipelotrichaceae bacterium]
MPEKKKSAEKKKTSVKKTSKESVKKKAVSASAHKTTKKTPVKKTLKKSEPALDPVFITKFDRYLFGKGTDYKVYQKMGAHKAHLDGKEGMHFAVWAPHAKAVSIICDRNNWDTEANYMLPLETSGIFEGFIPDMGYGEIYKYAIHTQDGEILYKADPYAFSAELRPGTASKTADIGSYKWNDAEWMKKRAETDTYTSPMFIYEVHLGSWLKKDDGTPDGFMNYREYAKELADYCKYMGYTHVELMGIAEHPFDGSWGYQVTGYYAPTSRYGSPDDFQYFVDAMHKNNIGVILDWVPAHFPKDAHGLADFDGTPTYEYADPRMGEHPDWGTKIFNYSKNEVKNFLIGNALYWYDEYHIDGLRVDAVASMLYLDYGRKAGEWVPNKYGGNGNLDAIEFFKHLNSVIRGRKDGTIIIAEESTAWPKITAAPEDDGLGFTYKWNMGWMHDFLDYMKLDPLYRKDNHNKMTFGMSYATSEKFILVISHDEVVHLKCSMINKMPGYEKDKFANLKCGYAFMTGHAGKKLLFMGQDFGQAHEWDEKVQLSWNESEQPLNKNLQDFVRDLLHMYTSHPSLYRKDDSWDGFKWINADDADRSIFSFIRRDGTGKKDLLFVINFTPMERTDYMVGAPKAGKYTLILNENGAVKPKEYKAVKGECDGQPNHISYPLPPYGIAVFEFDE